MVDNFDWIIDSCPGYWEERLKAERAERVQQAKEHWENQCRVFVGV